MATNEQADAELVAASHANGVGRLTLSKNPLQWGSTSSLPLHVIDTLMCDLNAGRGLSATEALMGTKITATVKLDGTNVGKISGSRQLVGRRFCIGSEEDTYQRTSVNALREIDASKVEELFLEETNVPLGTFIVYGELLCNHDYYDYDDTGLHGQWRAFGIAFAPANGQRANKIVAKLVKDGWAAHAGVCKNDDDKSTELVKVSANSRLLSLLQRAGMPTVEQVCPGITLGELIKREAMPGSRMMEQTIEGYVVTLDQPPVRLKWKISPELQPTAVEQLTKLEEAVWLPDEAREIVSTLRRVATAPLSDAFKRMVERPSVIEIAQAKWLGAGRNAEEEHGGESFAQLFGRISLKTKQSAAWESAKTKMDFAHLFAAASNAKVALDNVQQIMEEEMREDLTEEDLPGLDNFLKMQVGKELGEWKKNGGRFVSVP